MQDLDPSDICKKKNLNPLKRIKSYHPDTDPRTDGRTDRQTDRRTDEQGESSIPPLNFVSGGIMIYSYRGVFFSQWQQSLKWYNSIEKSFLANGNTAFKWYTLIEVSLSDNDSTACKWYIPIEKSLSPNNKGFKSWSSVEEMLSINDRTAFKINDKSFFQRFFHNFTITSVEKPQTNWSNLSKYVTWA